MPNEIDIVPRHLDDHVAQALEISPVVIVSGARQTGKSTLVRTVASPDRPYVTLDDLDAFDQAVEAPDDLVRRAERMTLDEVQRSPDLLLAIKRAVDEDRTNGRFLLTGSANLLLMQRVSESLAGRAQYATLWPLTRRERLGLGNCGVWGRLFELPVEQWEACLDGPVAQSWEELARVGGYPVPALELSDDSARQRWFAGYVQTYLERDLNNLAAIERLADFRRLLRACCLRCGALLNQAELARDIGLAPSTAQRYLNLLEVSYQLVRLPAYAVNRTKRLTKAPRLYWSDTGLAMHLAGESEPRGAHLENLLLCDLLTWRETDVRRPEILYWRTTKGAEVDFVLERDGELVAIEVKSATRVGRHDTRGLRTFVDEYREHVRGALVLHTGSNTFWIHPGVLAVPWWRVA